MAVRRAGEGSRGGGGFLERLGWVAVLNFCVNALLLEGNTYNQVIAQSDISSATLSRVSRCVQYGKGYSRLLKHDE